MSPIVRSAFIVVLIAAGARADDPPLIAPGEHRAPAEEAKAFRLPPGFSAQLVAAEPDIQKPINMAFDARGRLWVTCTVEYPFPAKDRPGRDTIKILDDFGPDGRARKITTFATGLNIPIGILPLPDCKSCIVSETGRILKLTDTDGDGKADKTEELFTGFGTEDTHGGTNSFHVKSHAAFTLSPRPSSLRAASDGKRRAPRQPICGSRPTSSVVGLPFDLNSRA